VLEFLVEDWGGIPFRAAPAGPPHLAWGRFVWLLDPAGTKIELWEPKKIAAR